MKRKTEKLYPDKVAETNMEFLKKLGKIADLKAVTAVLLQDAVQQYYNHGYNADEALVKAKEYMCSPIAVRRSKAMLSLNNWYWGGRQVYRFDEELSKILSSQTKDDMEIDVSVVEQLPCDNFYIMREYKNSYGFFVSLTKDDAFENPILIIGDIYEDENENTVKYDSSYIEVETGKTIKNILIEMSSKLAEDNCTQEDINAVSTYFCEKLQYILYLTAINAEIAPVTKGAVIKRSVSHSKTNASTQRYNKTEISNVGYKIGSAIKKSRQDKPDVKYIYDNNGDVEKKHGTPKTPHIRRSHFHSYWTGSGEERKIVVKWINAVFVNGDKYNDDDGTTTVHNVK